MQTTAFRTWMRHRGLGPETKEGPPTEAVLLPEATVPGPSVPDLKNDDHHDGRHQDRSGQYRQYRKHFAAPSANARERAERRFVPRPFKIQIRPVIFRGIMRKTSALILPISPGREAAA